jgi:uncharacterized protein involved in exopolysaccharide biosynthesis
MIRAYWLRIAVCGTVGLILGFLIALLTPKQYEGVVQVLMPPPESSLSRADSNEADTVIDYIQFTQPRNVNTQVETLTSLGVISTAAEKVAQRYNLPWSNGSELFPQDLQDKINITAATSSDLVTLRVRASHPEIARDVAGEMYKAFQEISQQSSTEFANLAITSLKTQIGKIDEQVNDLDKKTEEARKASSAYDIPTEIQTDYGSLRELELQYNTATQDAASYGARVAVLTSELANTPMETETQQVTAPDPQMQKLEADLHTAQADRDQLLGRYTEDNELVKMQDKRIESILKSMKSYKPKSEASHVRVINPIWSTLKGELAVSAATAASARDRVQVASSQLAAKKAEMQKLPELQTKMSILARQVNVLERVQATYRDRLASLEASGKGRRNPTGLITVAQASDRPVVPNTNLNISLGFVLGIAAGFLWSISTEARRNPIRSLGQLNRLALMPSYRAIPELRVPMRGVNRAPADVFDALLVNFIRSEKKGYRLGVLGVNKGAGATTTAMNLAIAAARGGYSVLYVEVDPGNNALTKLTPAAGDIKSPGANIAIYNASLGETQASGVIGLPSDFEVAAQGRDFVVFDFSPVKVSGDAFLIANQLDEMVLLVRANVTKSVDFLQAQQALIDTGCPLVTVSLSRVTEHMDDIAALEQQAEVRTAAPDA